MSLAVRHWCPMISPSRSLQKDDLKLDATVYQAAPAGPPFRYREAEEYRRIENHEGAYMFGSNSMLLDRWSKSVGA